MFTHRWRRSLRRRLWRALRAARGAARALGLAGRQLAERLAYHSREVGAVALLAVGLFGGLVIEQWRGGHPAAAERLEAEPIRPTSGAGSPATARPRPRRLIAASCEEPGVRTGATDQGDANRGGRQIDLNQATPGELARLARIPWRLAMRIVAARDAIEGHGATPPGPALEDAPAAEPPAPSAALEPGETAPDAEP
jgi:hypothetical protein